MMLAAGELATNTFLWPLSWLSWALALWLLVGQRRGAAPTSHGPRLSLTAICVAALVVVGLSSLLLLATAIGLDALEVRLPPMSTAAAALVLVGSLTVLQGFTAAVWLSGRRRADPLPVGKAVRVAALGAVLAFVLGILIQVVAVVLAVLLIVGVGLPGLMFTVGEARRTARGL